MGASLVKINGGRFEEEVKTDVSDWERWRAYRMEKNAKYMYCNRPAEKTRIRPAGLNNICVK